MSMWKQIPLGIKGKIVVKMYECSCDDNGVREKGKHTLALSTSPLSVYLCSPYPGLVNSVSVAESVMSLVVCLSGMCLTAENVVLNSKSPPPQPNNDFTLAKYIYEKMRR